MERIHKVLRNEYVYAIFSKIIIIALGLTNSIIIARYLGAELKGTLAYINSVTSISSIVMTFGVHQAYPYYRRKYGKDAYLSKYMTVITVVFSIYFVASVLVGLVLVQNEIATLSILTTPILAYAQIITYVYMVEEANKRNTVFIAVSIIEIIYIALLYVLTKANLMFAMSTLLLAEILKAIICSIKLKKHYRVAKVSISDYFDLVKYGFLPMIALLMTTFNYKVDVLMLKNTTAISTVQVGLYSLGYSIASKAMLIPDAMRRILLSKLAKGKNGDEVAKVIRVCIPICSLLAIAVIALGKPVLSVLYGSEYDGSYPIVVVSVIGTVFMIAFNMISQFNIINRHQARNTVVLAISVIVNVVLNLILVPIFGVIGAAYATVVSHIMCSVIFILLFVKETGITLNKVIVLQKEDLIRSKNQNSTEKGGN